MTTFLLPHGQQKGDTPYVALLHMQELAKTWRPVEFSVGSVCLLSRAGFMDPFRVRYEVPLGSAAEAVRVDVPYVATVGPGPSAADGKLVGLCPLPSLDIPDAFVLAWCALHLTAHSRHQRQRAECCYLHLSTLTWTGRKSGSAGMHAQKHVFLGLFLHCFNLWGVQAARYGLGALHDGVWYFAFGANLSTGKLTGSRGIEPLEALPGRLAGYHLAFNHRCGAWVLNWLTAQACGCCSYCRDLIWSHTARAERIRLESG